MKSYFIICTRHFGKQVKRGLVVDRKGDTLCFERRRTALAYVSGILEVAPYQLAAGETARATYHVRDANYLPEYLTARQPEKVPEKVAEKVA